MTSDLIREVVDFLKAALEKIVIGFFYGAGGLLGVHAAGLLLAYIFGA